MPGSKIDGLYGTWMLDPKADEVSLYEGPEDVALALTLGFNATGIISASSKLAASDVRLLSGYERIYPIGDQDIPGKKATNTIAAQLPPNKLIRVSLRSYKDIGDLWKASPDGFAEKLCRILRLARGSRVNFELADLLDEDEISDSENVDLYAIDKLVPCRSISMFFGEEKSGKSLLV